MPHIRLTWKKNRKKILQFCLCQFCGMERLFMNEASNILEPEQLEDFEVQISCDVNIGIFKGLFH
jgi:hypothetical protein